MYIISLLMESMGISHPGGKLIRGGDDMDALERIRSLMDARRWTEYKLAKESDLSQSTIANMFSRQTAPTIPTLEAVCKGFGITLS